MFGLLGKHRFRLECFLYAFIPFGSALAASEGHLPTWQQWLLAFVAGASGLKGKLSNSKPTDDSPTA